MLSYIFRARIVEAVGPANPSPCVCMVNGTCKWPRCSFYIPLGDLPSSFSPPELIVVYPYHIRIHEELCRMHVLLTVWPCPLIGYPIIVTIRASTHCKNDWVTLTQFGHLSCKPSIILCNSGNQKQVEVIQTFLQCKRFILCTCKLHFNIP